MSVFSALFDNKTYNFEQAFGVKDITSSDMRAAIRDWYGLYYQREPTKTEDPCQRLPVAIVSKLTKTTFSEYAASSEKEGQKGEYLHMILSALGRVRKSAMQNAFIGGQCLLKPVFTATDLCFAVIERRNYLVLGRNERDEITDIGTVERTVSGGLYYTLLERRTMDQNGFLTIESKLYRSSTADILGTEVPLGTMSQYENLEPVFVFPVPVHSVGLIPLQTPLENCVDGSADSVSIYAPASGLIHLINVNEAQINGEFERGKSRLVVSADLLQAGSDGKKNLTDDVFTALDDDPESVGVTIFSPDFREQSFLARKNEYLRNCETLIGMKRGILSEVEAAERTATEITSSAGDYNLTIKDLQEMWENTVREAVRVCDILGQMYRVCDKTPVDMEQDVTIDWGNGILYDEDKAWADYMSMVSSGMLRPEIALAWKFNIPWETPDDLAEIREKYMPNIEALTGDA